MSEATYRFDAVPVRPTGAMRTLDWGEIVARLDAMRELRATLPDHAPGSFAPAASRRLAMREHGMLGVNPTGLANSKDSGRIRAVVPDLRQSLS